MARKKNVTKKESGTTSPSVSSAANSVIKTLNEFSVKEQDAIITTVLAEIKLERLSKVSASQEMLQAISEGINSFNAAVQAGLNAMPEQQAAN